jgi:hypothetical protein
MDISSGGMRDLFLQKFIRDVKCRVKNSVKLKWTECLGWILDKITCSVMPIWVVIFKMYFHFILKQNVVAAVD